MLIVFFLFLGSITTYFDETVVSSAAKNRFSVHPYHLCCVLRKKYWTHHKTKQSKLAFWWWYGIVVSALVLINTVALHWAQLLHGQVTVCREVNHLG